MNRHGWIWIYAHKPCLKAYIPIQPQVRKDGNSKSSTQIQNLPTHMIAYSLTVLAIALALAIGFGTGTQEKEVRNRSLFWTTAGTVVMFLLLFAFWLGSLGPTSELAAAKEAHDAEKLVAFESWSHGMAPELPKDDTYIILGIGGRGKDKGFPAEKLIMVKGSKAQSPELFLKPTSLGQNPQFVEGKELYFNLMQWEVRTPKGSTSTAGR